MFRLLTEDGRADFLSFCSGRVIGSVLYTRLLAYGCGGGVMFWLADGGDAVASLADGVFTADYDLPGYAAEAEAFGRFLGAGQIVTPGYYERSGFSVMKGSGPFGAGSAQDISSEELAGVYSVMYEGRPSGGAPAYGAWLTDVSHKLRHGLIRGKCVRADGAPVAVALTSGESPGAAVISGVATLAAYRGKGYASAVVSALADSLVSSGMEPYVIAGPELRRFYERLGFRDQNISA